MPPHARARRQDLLEIQREQYGDDSLNRTYAGGVDPVVVIVVQVAEVEPMTAVLVSGFEGVACLHSSTTRPETSPTMAMPWV